METLVAITILLVAIVAPMTIATRGLSMTFYAREQMIAISLGQEGVELIRKIRDENALEKENWLADIPSAWCGGVNGCGLDARSDTTRNCGPANSTACRLNYDSRALLNRRGFYTYTPVNVSLGIQPSPFTRRIKVVPVGPVASAREAKVIVEVSWESGLFAGTKSVVVESRMFNQYDNL